MASRLLSRAALPHARRAAPRLRPSLAASATARLVSTRAAAPAASPATRSLAPALLAATGLLATTSAYAAAADDYSPTKEEIAKASDAINELLDDEDDLGPTLVRLAWHASGTYDKDSDTGGSDGATMRFPPESAYDANAGLGIARAALAPIKKRFPGISYADLWTVR